MPYHFSPEIERELREFDTDDVGQVADEIKLCKLLIRRAIEQGNNRATVRKSAIRPRVSRNEPIQIVAGEPPTPLGGSLLPSGNERHEESCTNCTTRFRS